MNNKFVKKIYFCLLLICIYASPIWAHHRDSLTIKNVEFIENKGQWDESVLFKAPIHGGAVFAEKDCFTFVVLEPNQLKEFYAAKFNQNLSVDGRIDAVAYKMHFLNANAHTHVIGQEKMLPYNNYFIGRDSRHWATHVAKFHSVLYQELYSGIDLLLTQEDAHLKYEFTIAPHTSPQQIQLEYEGIQNLFVAKGNLIIATNVMQIIELKPVAYQISNNGKRIYVDCAYKVNQHKLSFDVGDYNTDLPLVIDPVLIFASYSGSTSDNWGYSATYDKYGNLYSGGNVFGIGYPLVTGAFQINFGGGSTDIAISKFDTQGTFLHYSTYLGGSGSEVPHSLIVNDNDELYVLGTTSSSDYPVTADAYDTLFHGGSNFTLTNVVQYTGGSDIIITKFNATGDSLLGSTYLGGSANDGLNNVVNLRKNYADEVRGEIIIDEQSNVYVVSSTQSADFPVTPTAFQPQFSGGRQDGCIVKFNHNLSNLIWSTFFGGSGDDAAYSIVRASDNSLYVCGGTTSTDIPTSPNAIQSNFGGGLNDGFVAHINANGNQLLDVTYLGYEGYDQAYLIKNDRFDNPHIFGQTNASGNSWIHNAQWNVPGAGQFLIKLTPALDSIIWSTAFGTGRNGLDISPTALLVDLCNNIYMSGWGSPITNFGQGGTSGLPVTIDAYQNTTDNNDYYFICISDDASQLVYATYFGSPNAREHVDGGTSRFDNHGRIYQAVCAGCGGFDDFPTTYGAWSQQNNSTNCNIGVIKFDFNLPAVVAEFDVPNTICAPQEVTMHNTSQQISDTTNFYWDFGDGTTSQLESPSHLYTQSGTYTITLIVRDEGSCNFADTTSHTMVVLSNSNSTLADTSICIGDFVQIGIAPSGNPNVTYEWQPETNLNNPHISNPIADPSSTTDYMLFVSDGICIDTITQKVKVESITVDAGENRTICLGDSLTLVPMTTGPTIRYYWATNPSFRPLLNSDIYNPLLTVSPTQATTYYLRVESNHCTEIDSVTIDVSSFEITSPQGYEICYGDTIQIYVTPSVQGNYTYSWIPTNAIVAGETTYAPWVAPTANTHFIATATNEIGCTATDTVPVVVKTYQINTLIHHVSCHGGSDGSIGLDVSGGTPPYYFQWSNGATTDYVSSLTAGSYTVLITAADGCSAIDTFVIQQPQPLTVTLIEAQSINCDQICNGLLEIAANGGTAPYSYSWLNGAVGSRIDSLCAGNYSVVVTDANQCQTTGVFAVTDTSFNELDYTIQQPLCAGDCAGAIYLIPQFGDYQYTIVCCEDSIPVNDSLTSLCAGNYTFYVHVENGCQYHLYLQVADPAPLQFLNFYVTEPLCYGDANGRIQFNVGGGTPPYTYWVNDNPATPLMQNLEAGSYHIVVRDSNGCEIDTTVSLTMPAPLQITESHLSPPCPEVCAGSITLTPTGGTVPYSYFWSNNQTTAHIESLCAGNYSVTVSDAHNCIATFSIMLEDSSHFPVNIEAWGEPDTLYEGYQTTLHVTECGNDFTYQWRPAATLESPTAPNTVATPTQTTNYIITATDLYGCVVTDTVLIYVRKLICDEPYVFVPNAFTPNGDGKNDVLFVRGEIVTAIKFEIFDRWGEKVFSTTQQSEGWDGTFRGKMCEVGVYDYYLEVICIGENHFFKKGNVTLIR